MLKFAPHPDALEDCKECSWTPSPNFRHGVITSFAASLSKSANTDSPIWPRIFLMLCLFGALLPLISHAQEAIPPLLSTPFSEGDADCPPHTFPPLEVRRFDSTTYVLRESLCATSEAPFMYLVIGRTRALLIDTGDVASAEKMPLAKTVLDLLPDGPSGKLPLLVVHTHRHLDHRLGDAQFKGLPNVELVGYDIESVKSHFGFTDWPNGEAHIDLGERTVDVIPTPGHNETHLAFYDANTALLFSGDFLMPGRLLIENKKVDLASARRLVDFANKHPISYILGGHVEINKDGKTFSWGSSLHKNEHVLQLTKDDLMALPEAIEHFNGFYTHFGPFIMQNQFFVSPFFT